MRIYDTSGDGGFCGDAKDFYLKSDDTTIPLTGDWSWQKSMSAAEVKAHFENEMNKLQRTPQKVSRLPTLAKTRVVPSPTATT